MPIINVMATWGMSESIIFAPELESGLYTAKPNIFKPKYSSVPTMPAYFEFSKRAERATIYAKMAYA